MPESTPPPRGRRRWQLALPGAGLLVAAVYLTVTMARSAGTERSPRRAPRPVPVVAQAARTGDVRVYLGGIGTVTPLASVTVKSRVDGQLTSVDFREGQVVRAGDPLAEVDPRPFAVLLTQAEGQLLRDKALLANAQADLERYEGLLADNTVSKQQVDAQKAQVSQYEGAIKADQGKVDDITLQLSFCHITAPVAGRLGLRLVDAGNLVRTEDAGGIVVITQVEPIGLVFGVPEDDLPRLLTAMKAGGPLAVEAFDREHANRIATGTLLTIDNQIDPTTGTVKLKAELKNEDGALFPNQFVNARVLVEVRRGATLVPRVAIQRGAQGPFVFVVTDDKRVETRAVRPGVEEAEDVSIESGISPGELVVVEGADALEKGSVVTLEAPRAAAPATASP